MRIVDGLRKALRTAYRRARLAWNVLAGRPTVFNVTVRGQLDLDYTRRAMAVGCVLMRADEPDAPLLSMLGASGASVVGCTMRGGTVGVRAGWSDDGR